MARDLYLSYLAGSHGARKWWFLSSNNKFYWLWLTFHTEPGFRAGQSEIRGNNNISSRGEVAECHDQILLYLITLLLTDLHPPTIISTYKIYSPVLLLSLLQAVEGQKGCIRIFLHTIDHHEPLRKSVLIFLAVCNICNNINFLAQFVIKCSVWVWNFPPNPPLVSLSVYKREGYLKHNNTESRESRESQEMMMMVMNFTLEVAKLNQHYKQLRQGNQGNK